MSKQLQQNQTDINERLIVYDEQVANLTLQVSLIFIITAFTSHFYCEILCMLAWLGYFYYIYLQVLHLSTRLSLLEKKTNENTGLISNPDATKDPSVKDLSSQVAKLGSKYQDLFDSVKSLKDSTSSLQSYQTKLKTNITLINVC